MTAEPRSDATSELDAMLEESRKQFDALYGDADARAPAKPTPAPEPAAPATRPVAPVDETTAPNSAPASIQGSAAGVAFSVAPTPNNAAASRAVKKDTPG